jgi:hypothetical protein
MAERVVGRARVVLCFLIFLTVAFGFPRCAGAGEMEREEKVKSPGGEAALLAKSRAMGTMRILVRVRIENGAAAPAKKTPEDARALLKAQDRLLSGLARQGLKPVVAYKYKYTPFMAMTVDAAVLKALLLSPDAVSIEEDIPVPPTKGPE